MEEQRQLGKKSQQEQLMWVQRCKTHYGTDTNWTRAGWRQQSGPENTSNVERHTEVMNQIQLLRTIARVDAALRDGPQVARVTRSQDLVLEGGMEFAAQPPGEVVHHINRALEEVPDGQFENVQRQTGAAN